MLNVVSCFGMSVRSITLAAFLLVIGCATKEGHPTAARTETGVGASELQEVGPERADFGILITSILLP